LETQLSETEKSKYQRIAPEEAKTFGVPSTSSNSKLKREPSPGEYPHKRVRVEEDAKPKLEEVVFIHIADSLRLIFWSETEGN
jgi:hypothetical protein